MIRILVGFNHKLGRIDVEFAVLPLSLLLSPCARRLPLFHRLSISVSVYPSIWTFFFFGGYLPFIREAFKRCVPVPNNIMYRFLTYTCLFILFVTTSLIIGTHFLSVSAIFYIFIYIYIYIYRYWLMCLSPTPASN